MEFFLSSFCKKLNQYVHFHHHHHLLPSCIENFQKHKAYMKQKGVYRYTSAYTGIPFIYRCCGIPVHQVVDLSVFMPIFGKFTHICDIFLVFLQIFGNLIFLKLIHRIRPPKKGIPVYPVWFHIVQVQYKVMRHESRDTARDQNSQHSPQCLATNHTMFKPFFYHM